MVPRHPSVGGSPKDAKRIAEVAELAYAQVSEACAARLEGSTPSFRTISHEEKRESNRASTPISKRDNTKGVVAIPSSTRMADPEHRAPFIGEFHTDERTAM